VGLTSVIHLEAPGVVRELRVEVTILHTFRGDLKVELVSPTGRRVTLHNRTGGGSDNLSLVLSSAPPSVLSPMIGQSITGDWLLRVFDLAARDTGAVDRWSVAVVPGT
jgi:subtilisin-like proprotein convertase family protein